MEAPADGELAVEVATRASKSSNVLPGALGAAEANHTPGFPRGEHYEEGIKPGRRRCARHETAEGGVV